MRETEEKVQGAEDTSHYVGYKRGELTPIKDGVVV